MDEYISGYAMVPGLFFTLLGSTLGGLVFFLLMAAIAFVCFILLVHIIVSWVLIKKGKMRTDATLKMILLTIGLVFSVFFMRYVFLTILATVPLFVSMIEYRCEKKETEEKM